MRHRVRRAALLMLLALATLVPVLLPARPPTAEAQRAGALLVRDAYDRLLNLYVDPLDPGALLGEAWNGVAGAALAAGVDRLPALPPLPAGRREAWALFAESYAELERRVAGQILPSDLAHTAIGAMTEARNECHTYFLTPARYTAFRQQLDGQQRFVGAGISISSTSPYTITRVIPDSPAERAGLLAGDVILAIDGVPAAEHTPASLRSRIAGEAGTPVSFTVARAGELEARLITVIRGVVHVPAVAHALRPDGIGVVTISTFAIDGTTERQTRAALLELEEQGATAWVLDLRYNPGGSVTSVLRVLGLFTGREIPAITTTQRGRAPVEAMPIGPALAVQRPMAVLVGPQSASGAEIVAAVLQDTGRARIVGQRTSGCANAGTLTELADGSAMVITSARLLAGPLQRAVDGPGVEPDELVTRSAPGDPALEAAVAYLLARRAMVGQP